MQIKSPNDIKNSFESSGKTITEWAAANGFARNDVYKVLNGQLKCKRGKGHKIAIALGIKKDTSQKANA